MKILCINFYQPAHPLYMLRGKLWNNLPFRCYFAAVLGGIWGGFFFFFCFVAVNKLITAKTLNTLTFELQNSGEMEHNW